MKIVSCYVVHSVARRCSSCICNRHKLLSSASQASPTSNPTSSPSSQPSISPSTATPTSNPTSSPSSQPSLSPSTATPTEIVICPASYDITQVSTYDAGTEVEANQVIYRCNDFPWAYYCSQHDFVTSIVFHHVCVSLIRKKHLLIAYTPNS